MTQQLLFVCTANVCRSPMMQFSFQEEQDLDEQGLTVGSAGIDAPSGHAMCRVGSGIVTPLDGGPDFAERHAATQLTQDLLSASHMIIAPGRPERGLLAQRDPGARSRTFTLGEAVELGRSPFSPEEMAHLRVRVAKPNPEPLRLYAAALNARRGKVAVNMGHRWSLPGKTRSAGQDVPDVHATGTRTHVRSLRELRTTVHRLRDQWVLFRESAV